MRDALADALADAQQRAQMEKLIEAQARTDRFMIKAFKNGFDTFRLAKVLNKPESAIANRLARLRDSGAFR